MNSTRYRVRDSTLKNSKLLAEKLEERLKKSALKRRISPKVGSVLDNDKETEEYSKADINLSTNSQESIENLDNLEVLEDETFNNPVLAMDLEAYKEWLREINNAR